MTTNTRIKRIILTTHIALLVGWVLLWGGVLWGIWAEAKEMKLAEQLGFTGVVVVIFPLVFWLVLLSGED